MEKPAAPNPAMDKIKRRLKKWNLKSHTKAATKSGNVSSITQFSAMPKPQIIADAFNHRSSLPTRYSSRHQTAAAKSRRSSISPVAAVAPCQKLNSSPHVATASNNGNRAFQPLSADNGRNHGSNSKDRANIPSVTAPQTAKNRFKTTAAQAPGNSCKGSVSSQTKGWLDMGRQSHPATLAVSARLFSVTPWLKVSP